MNVCVKNISKDWGDSTNNISIIAIYPGDDYLLWVKTEYPQKWINGYDKDLIIIKESLYDLQAFPTMYLLDKNKKVILKDTSIENILIYFSSYDIE